MISERLIDVTRDCTGEFIVAYGQFRSYNCHDEQKNRLVLSVFVRDVEFTGEETDGSKTNQISGRIQSRTYIKKLNDDNTEERTAYEVSVSKLECLDY